MKPEKAAEPQNTLYRYHQPGVPIDEYADTEWLLEKGILIPVTHLCVEHGLPPIDDRGFCAQGTEENIGTDEEPYWDWDCGVYEIGRSR